MWVSISGSLLMPTNEDGLSIGRLMNQALIPQCFAPYARADGGLLLVLQHTARSI